MAKNKIYAATNHYANQDEQIRKAKGNPNKNVHSKKKNSNYGGYNPAGAGAYMVNKMNKKAANRERVQLPTSVKVVLGVLLAAVVVVLILRMTVFADNLWLTNIGSLLLGVACLVLFYVRKHYHKRKTGSGYAIITLLLTVFGVIYTVIGAGGLLSQLGLF